LKETIKKEIERLKKYQEQLQREILGTAYQIAELERLLKLAERSCQPEKKQVK